MSAASMRNISLLLLTLVLLTTASAQVSKWGVSFTPAFLATNEPRYAWQAGTEYRINDRLSILTELAIRTGANKDSSAFNSKYFRIKPEIRYITSKRSSGVQYYTGLQFTCSFRKWDELNGGFYFNDHLYNDSTVTYDRAKVSSPVFTASVQEGVVVELGPQFALDIFTGLGVRVINTKYTELENTGKDYYQPPTCRMLFTPNPAYWVNGTVTRFHMNMGFRVIYRF